MDVLTAQQDGGRNTDISSDHFRALCISHVQVSLDNIKHQSAAALQLIAM
jgi:hypothetical protein